MVSLQSQEQVKGGGLKNSASDTMIVAGGGPSHMVSGHSPASDIPEFYRSDLLRVLEEKTDYMTRFYDAEEENDLLRQQLDRFVYNLSSFLHTAYALIFEGCIFHSFLFLAISRF